MHRLAEVLARPAAVGRLSTALAAGLGIALLVGIRHSVPNPLAWWAPLVGIGFLSYYLRRGLRHVLRAVGFLLRRPRRRWYGLVVLLLAAVAVGWLGWRAGPGRPAARGGGGLGAVLAAGILLLSGGWLCLLTFRRVRTARSWLLRHLPDALLAGFTGLGLAVLFSRDLLAAPVVAGLLVPLGGWAAVRTWRVMAGSSRLAVRAGADIVLSLLLGADLVLFLVWLANLLDLPRAEVVAVRAVLARIGAVAGLPWWLWTVGYLLLAAASLAFALRPGWLAAVPGWARRVPLVRSVDRGRRLLSGVHIGLLVAVLIGATAPTAVPATMRGQLLAKYTVALQRQLAAEGAQAAYAEIRRAYTAPAGSRPSARPPVTGPPAGSPPPTPLPGQPPAGRPPGAQPPGGRPPAGQPPEGRPPAGPEGRPPAGRPPLAEIVSRIHRTSPPPPGTDEASGVARDLAGRIGRLQAGTLRLGGPPGVLATPPAAGAVAPFEPPVRGIADLRGRLDSLDARQQAAQTAAGQARQAAELAATAVANSLPLLGFGQHETVQLLTEYLQGLVEGSPLKDVFFAWGKRLAGAAAPPPAGDIVSPEPRRLLLAAFSALTRQLATVRLAAPFLPDPVQDRLRDGSPAEAAVDLTNETRFLDEGGTGPCEGCPRPLRPGEEPRLGPGEGGAPGERPREPPPRPHIR